LADAGDSNEGVLDSQVPLFYPNLQSSPYDWNSTTIPQKFANGRTVHYARGYILGGTSSISKCFALYFYLTVASSGIDGMVYTRGSSDDYDRWARVTNDPGWSWDQIFPYFKKVSTLSLAWGLETED
jgi:choline dehydrogenase